MYHNRNQRDSTTDEGGVHRENMFQILLPVSRELEVPNGHQVACVNTEEVGLCETLRPSRIAKQDKE